MILPEQGASDRAKVVVFVQSGCIRAKWLYSGKVFVFGQNGCVRAKVVVLRQRFLYSCNMVVFE